jgi:hypothetical protein
MGTSYCPALCIFEDVFQIDNYSDICETLDYRTRSAGAHRLLVVDEPGQPRIFVREEICEEMHLTPRRSHAEFAPGDYPDSTFTASVCSLIIPLDRIVIGECDCLEVSARGALDYNPRRVLSVRCVGVNM